MHGHTNTQDFIQQQRSVKPTKRLGPDKYRTEISIRVTEGTTVTKGQISKLNKSFQRMVVLKDITGNKPAVSEHTDSDLRG